MDRKWIVFGGWGCPPVFLQPLFGSSSTYIDSNERMPLLFDGCKLAPDWAGRFFAAFKDERWNSVAGWSMGAFFAWEFANRLCPRQCVLLSSTPSFCHRERFLSGHRPAVLRAMIASLAKDRKKVSEEFFVNCGMQSSAATTSKSYTLEMLQCGLRFLEQANLIPVARAPFPATFLHGVSDRIIPIAAGRSFSEMAGGIFKSYPGGHAFFLDHGAEIKEFLECPKASLIQG